MSLNKAEYYYNAFHTHVSFLLLLFRILIQNPGFFIFKRESIFFMFFHFL
jgi:hypothetical protein